jgi:hypothetical protein
MDADADRDFVLGTHIFLSAIAGTDASHPCVYGDAYCISANYAPYGYLDGAGIWDALKDVAGLRAIITGHSHSVFSAQMTGTNGNLVQALSTWNVSYGGWGNIILMKFRTDNNTIEFYSWKTAQNVADQAVWGAPKIVGWPDTKAPSVSMTAPADGATVSGTVTLSATASDNRGVAGVQFLIDEVALGPEATSEPYAMSWDSTTASSGSHTLSARARDAAGNVATSAAVSVAVDNMPPTISMTAPVNGATVSGITTVSATASDNIAVVGVQFLLDGVALGAEDTTAPFSISWDSATASSGSHTLSAQARDAAGNVTTSASTMVSVTSDNAAPTISMTAPVNGTTVSGTVTLSATASDNIGVVGVQFLLDGVALGTEDRTAPYSISWNTQKVSAGKHVLSARARDAAGNQTTSAGIAVTVSKKK